MLAEKRIMPKSTAGFRYVILGLLAQQPMSGYDVRRLLQSISWLTGTPSAGSIYPSLRGLLQADLVTVDVQLRPDRPPRKVYTPTEAGRQELRRSLERPVAPGASMKAFVNRLIVAGSQSSAALVSDMRQRKSDVEGWHSTLAQLRGSLDGGPDRGQRMVIDYALSVARAEIAWLSDELDRVSQELSVSEVE